MSPSRDDASKIPETGQLINCRNLFLRVLETERPQIKSPADSQMREGIIDQVLFLCVNIVQSASQPHGNSSTRAAISFIRSVLRSPTPPGDVRVLLMNADKTLCFAKHYPIQAGQPSKCVCTLEKLPLSGG